MALRSQLTNCAHRLRMAGARRVSVDRRALVALRVALASLLLADLLLRTRSLRIFYTDAGALPRSMLYARYPLTAHLSIHTLFGGAWWTILLFALAGVAALALLTGYRTRTAAICSWLLLVSLHVRNPLVLNGGDSLLRRTLLWSLFLPLGTGLTFGGATSGRSERDEDDENAGVSWRERTVRHPAAASLLLQPIVIYVVNAIIKLRGTVWPSGKAVRLVFSMESLTVLFGPVLANYPGMLESLGIAWLVLLCCSPLLLLTTGWARAVVAAAYGVAHAGMALTLGVGLFPFVSIAALVPFLPPPVWDALERRWGPTVERLRTGARSAGIVRVRAAVDSLLTRTTLRRASLPTRTALRRAGRIVQAFGERNAVSTRRFGRTLATVLLVIVVVWNAAALGVVDVPDTERVGVGPQETRWDMFAPSPPTEDVWYVAVGTLESGEVVEVIRGGDPEWTRTGGLGTTYPSARWRKYLEEIRWSDDEALRRHFAAALCTRWNARNDDDPLDELTVYTVHQPTRLDGAEPTLYRRVQTHECAGEKKPT